MGAGVASLARVSARLGTAPGRDGRAAVDARPAVRPTPTLKGAGGEPERRPGSQPKPRSGCSRVSMALFKAVIRDLGPTSQ